MLENERLKQIIGANVARYRGHRTKVWLARAVGTYPANVSRIEDGAHMPGAGLLVRLAGALKVKVDDLVRP